MTPAIHPYSDYKPSGIPWLGDVPDHWEVVRLRNVVAGTTERNRPDLPLLSVVRERGVILRDITNTEENHNFVPDDLSNYKVVHSGQFAMNKMKAWQGSYGISQHDGLVSPAYFVFDLHGVTGGYFHAAIRSMAYVPFFAQASDGVRIGQWDLSQARMREIPFPLPPLPEQAAIVRYLNHADRRIRRYVSTKRKLIALLEEEKQAIINRAVTRGLDPNVRLKPSGVEWLGDVPEGWNLTKFKFLVKITSGQVDPRNEVYRGKILVAPNHIRSGAGEIFSEETAEQQGAMSGKYAVQRGQVIYSKIRPNLRKAALAREDCICSADMYPLAVREDDMRAEFLLLLLLSVPFTKFAVDCSLRAAMPKINREALGEGWLWYPDLNSQDGILRQIEDLAQPLDRAIARTRRQIDLLQEYRTRLIADVVTGKLDVREAAALLPDDPEDEESINEESPLAEDTYGDSHDPDVAAEELAMESEVTI